MRKDFRKVSEDNYSNFIELLKSWEDLVLLVKHDVYGNSLSSIPQKARREKQSSLGTELCVF